MRATHALVGSLEERFAALETEFHRAYWDSQVEATPANERRRAELEIALRAIKGDARALADVRGALDAGTDDRVVRRQLQTLYLSLAGNQMSDDQRARIVELSTAVEGDFAAFRPRLEEREVSDNDIVAILGRSDDEHERRAAWEASKEIGTVVSDRVRELARVRNEVARDQGWPDYYKMALELQELSEGWLFALLDDLEELTREPFRRWKASLDAALHRRFGATDVQPWHYADPFFQQLPPDGRPVLDELLGDASAPHLALETFGCWGIDLSGVMGASDLYPRSLKCQHAFCLDVDRSGEDVRILANIVPGERWVEVMLHESGHAAYDVAISADLPYLLHRPAHTLVTEAIAILSGKFVHDAEWLRALAGVSEPDVAALHDGLVRAEAARSLLFARWGLVVVHFERDLYADPDGDLDARWWELVQRFQFVAPPAGRAAPDWAAKIHVAVAPVYYQNYLLGELLAAQVAALSRRSYGHIAGSAGAGAFLTERLFRHGSRFRWDELVEHATGAPLGGADFAAGIEAHTAA